MSGRNLLILDIDETLVHGSEKELDRAADFRVGPYHVYRRPYLADFITAMQQSFDLAVWSSASAGYVYGVVEQVFGASNELRFVWSNDRCTRRFDFETYDYFYAKNLSKLRKLGFQLEHVLMLDDSPEKLAKHYGNYIRIAPFHGDLTDRELLDLIPFALSLQHVENVRRIEKRFWRRSDPCSPSLT